MEAPPRDSFFTAEVCAGSGRQRRPSAAAAPQVQTLPLVSSAAQCVSAQQSMTMCTALRRTVELVLLEAGEAVIIATLLVEVLSSTIFVCFGV